MEILKLIQLSLIRLPGKEIVIIAIRIEKSVYFKTFNAHNN